MTQNVGQKILITYNAKSVSKHPVRGMSTKTYYGYRRRGDQFEVYEADMRVRPDLFRPIQAIQPAAVNTMPSHRGRPQEAANVLGVKAVASPVQDLPEPPEEIYEEPTEPDPYELPPPLEMQPESVSSLESGLDSFDWGKTVNKNHLRILAENDITTLMDLVPLTEDNVLAIKGIGPNVTRALFAKLAEQQQ